MTNPAEGAAERERFEAFVASMADPDLIDVAIERHGHGYRLDETQMMWESWQAALVQSQSRVTAK